MESNRKRVVTFDEHSKEKKIHVSDDVLYTEDHYFESYAHVGIHEEMIKDHERTNSYRKAILQNAHYFKNKVVADVGAGTCILSMFCVQAGAKKVYAIEASSIIQESQKVVKALGMEENITIIHGKVEEVELPEKVDIIVSEWMGYCLLYETMLDSVIIARDRWLKPSGVLFPSEAKLYISLFTDESYWEERINFWTNVYGFDYSAMIPYAKYCAFEEPLVEMIPPQNLLSFPIRVRTIDIKTVTREELKVTNASFCASSIIVAQMHGFVLWFDVSFPHCSESTGNQIILSTSPEASYTHWKQCLLYIPQPLELVQDQQVQGNITIETDAKNIRCLNFAVNYEISGVNYLKTYALR